MFRYKNGNEVSADARIKITKEGTETYNLTVTLLKLEDTGDYEVKATNEQGTVSSVTKVTVSSKCNSKYLNACCYMLWLEEHDPLAFICVFES